MIPEIEAKALAEALNGPNPPLLVDVRTEAEHQLAAIEPSVLVPLHEIEERAADLEPHKARTLVVYCHLGVRSLDGAAYLRSLGYDAVSLAGGIEAWSCDVDPRVPRY